MPETRRLRKMAADQEKPDRHHEICISSGNEEDESPSDMNIQRKNLRQRWELASILNFFNVFELVIQSKMKISAEEIEAGLIVPNDFLAQLHIMLLRGVAPASKLLNVPDAWVSLMSKKLTLSWPWVAEGDNPFTAAKGEEMNKYKELDPAARLYILKALCELRADREDVLTFINENIKTETGLSTLQKEKLGEDGRGTVYWYDGNENIGHRLYKEIRKFGSKHTVKGRGNPLGIVSQWETLATNYEEFQKVVSEFSSSKVKLEVAVAKALQENIIPALERLQKKKEALLKRQRKQERLLAACHNSAITRTGRARKPVNYRYDEYDKAITRAINVHQHRKMAKEHKRSIQSDHFSEKHHNADDEPEDVSIDTDADDDSLNDENNEDGNTNRSMFSSQNMSISEGTTKQRLRQRPTVNTAIEYAIVPDSDDENASKDTNKRRRISGSSSQATDTDNDDFS